MKHNKIFSSEVVHKGKTLDRVLEGSGGGDSDIVTIEFDVILGDGAVQSKDSLTTKDFSASTETMAKMIKAVYDCKLIKLVVDTTSMTGGGELGPVNTKAVNLISTSFMDIGNQTTPICNLYWTGTMGVSQSNQMFLQYNGSFRGRQQEAFELAGLTIEDFYRKFFPDNPFFPAE